MTLNEVLGANRIEIETGGYCRFDVQLTNSPHRHDYYEVCLVLSGSGVYHHGGRVYGLVPGDVFIADRGVTHEITSYETKDLHLYFVSLTLTHLDAVASGPEDELIDAFQEGHRIVNAGPETLRSYLALIRPDQAGFSAFASREALKLFVLEMLATLTSVRPAGEAETGSDEIARALDYIDRNLRRRLTVEEIADAVGVSARTLRRRFRDLSGTTVAQEINHRRMRWAAHRLLMGFAVAEVSEYVGISDPAQFTRAFVRSHGMTPKRFQASYVPGRLAFQTRP